MFDQSEIVAQAAGIAPFRDPTSRVRGRIIAVALAFGAVAIAVIGLWRPVDELRTDEAIPYAAIEAAGGEWLTWHVLDGMGTAITAIALGLAVCALAPARGAMWANVGAVIAAVGGLSFLPGIVGLGLVGAYAVETRALPADAGNALVAYINDQGGPALAFVIPGFLLFTLGQLVLSIALWRARTVPLWLPIGVIVLNAAGFALSTGTVYGVLLAVLSALYAVVAWYAWRGAPARTA